EEKSQAQFKRVRADIQRRCRKKQLRRSRIQQDMPSCGFGCCSRHSGSYRPQWLHILLFVRLCTKRYMVLEGRLPFKRLFHASFSCPDARSPWRLIHLRSFLDILIWHCPRLL
ncbi:hypothetical protein M514_17589, partial [Trichuris suis]